MMAKMVKIITGEFTGHVKTGKTVSRAYDLTEAYIKTLALPETVKTFLLNRLMIEFLIKTS